MGKRKSAKQVQTRRAPKLDTAFNCLFCNHEKSISVKIDKKDGLGRLKCSKCPKTFVAKVHTLEAPVDVYFKWLDACEDANRAPVEDPPTPPPKRARLSGTVEPASTRSPPASRRRIGKPDLDEYEDDELDDLDELDTGDSGLPTAGRLRRTDRHDPLSDGEEQVDQTGYSSSLPEIDLSRSPSRKQGRPAQLDDSDDEAEPQARIVATLEDSDSDY